METEMFKTPIMNEKLQMDIKINFYLKRNKNCTEQNFFINRIFFPLKPLFFINFTLSSQSIFSPHRCYSHDS